MYGKEISWMIEKATVELVDGFKVGSFRGKLNYRMAQPIIAEIKTWQHNSTSDNFFSKILWLDDTDSIVLKVYGNNEFVLNYEFQN